MIIPFKEEHPRVSATAFVAPDAWVIGDVTIAESVSIFFGAVLRGDLESISVGARSNIPDTSLVHTTHGRSPAVIGEDVTIGHRAIIHGCTIGNRCLIGMGSIVLDDAVIEEDCLVGAGSVVTERKHFPKRSLILGSPAKVVRTLTDEEVAKLPSGAKNYVELGAYYASTLPQPPRP